MSEFSREECWAPPPASPWPRPKTLAQGAAVGTGAGAARWRAAAVVPLSARRQERQDLGRRLGQGGDGRRISGLGKARRRADGARARRPARTALACQCGGMGLRAQRPLPGDGDRPGRPFRDRRFRRRRRVVFPARPRPFDPGHRRRGLPVRPGVRQRLLLGVRHLQHQRLARPHAARGAGEELRGAGAVFAGFPKREVYIAKGPVPPPLPAEPAPGTLNSGALTHRYRLLAQRPQRLRAGRKRAGVEREFPISATMTGALMRIKPGGLRELHWHPNADEWQYYIAAAPA